MDTDTTLDCKEFGKTFANSANLRRHITTQHNKWKAVARAAFASLNPSHANICKYKYVFFHFDVKCTKFVSLAIDVNTI